MRVHGCESRPQTQLFETYTIDTRMLAQKWVDGAWHLVRLGANTHGYLGPPHAQGHMNVAPFVWPGRAPVQTNPRFHVPVTTDDSTASELRGEHGEPDRVPLRVPVRAPCVAGARGPGAAQVAGHVRRTEARSTRIVFA